VLGPSSIKHLLPSGVKLALSRTTRLQTFKNSLKCATLCDCYEYGSETIAGKHGTDPTPELVCTLFLPANHKARKKKEVVHLYNYASYENIFVTNPYCFVNLPCCYQFAHKLKPNRIHTMVRLSSILQL